ncbi:MAG: YMGG-like glycine zipper-containing protein [Terriglobia bacterium]
MKHLARIYLLGVAALLLSTAVWADTLEFKNGRVIEGKFLGGTQETLRFQYQGQIQVFRVTDLLALTFGGTTGSLPPAPTPPGPAPATSPTPATPAASAAPVAVTAPASPVSSVVVPAGTYLRVRMIDSVDSSRNSVGDRFAASLDEDLVAGDVVVARKGTEIYGRLAQAKESGQITGTSQLRLELTEILINGVAQPMVTGEYEATGESRTKDTARKAGGGAALGAIIGAIAGGGKGAAIGAGVGAGAGTAVQVMTHGEQVRVPSETLLEFRLEQPLTVRVAPAAGK